MIDVRKATHKLEECIAPEYGISYEPDCCGTDPLV